MGEELAEAFAAALGGGFSKLALYPMDIIKNNLQALAAGSPREITQTSVAKELIGTYGVGGLYCGWYWAGMSGFFEKGIYFFAYAFARNAWIKYIGPFNTVGQLVIGYMCEWSHTPFVQPIDRMLVMTQTDSTRDPLTGKGPVRRSNIARIHSVYSTKGIAGFYKGLASYFLLACKPALQYYTFNFVRGPLPGCVSTCSLGLHF
jgi:hypothetical protein